jgi:hypothetical protein
MIVLHTTHLTALPVAALRNKLSSAETKERKPMGACALFASPIHPANTSIRQTQPAENDYHNEKY